MIIVSNLACVRPREVLLTLREPHEARSWLDEVESGLRPARLLPCPCSSGSDAIRRVEDGGLAAAVLFGDRWETDGLSLLRIIRSIDEELPCWLVIPEATPRALQAAWSLRVSAVMTRPLEATTLSLVLTKALAGLG